MSAATLPMIDRPVRLLVVDDSRAMQAIIRRVLETAPLAGPSGAPPAAVDIRTAADGEEALTQRDAFAPDLIISDWHMPRMSGLEMLQALRQSGGTHPAVGFVTTETSEQLLQQAHTNGAAFVVRKPFRDGDLLEAVRRALALPGGPGDPALARTEAMRHWLASQLPNTPLRLAGTERFTPEALGPQNLLALYAHQADGQVAVIGLANTAAVCIIGGSLAGLSPQRLRETLLDGRPDAASREAAVGFFRDSLPLARAQLEAGPLTWKGGNLVPREFDKVRLALARQGQRVDYRISVPGFGDGHLAFLRP